jgi:hypothetical protein
MTDQQRIENACKMVDDCMEVLTIPKRNGGPGFSEWERGFIQSIDAQLMGRGKGKSWITEKQYDTLEKVWNKI